MDEYQDGWLDGWMDGWSGRMDEWMKIKIYTWKDESMNINSIEDGWMNGWILSWLVELTN